jgi:hypothetical protein
MWRFFSWWNRNESRFGNWAGILGLIGLMTSLPFFASTTKEVIYAVSLVLLCVGGFVSTQAYNFRLGRKARHAEIISHIREAVRLIVEETAHGGKHGLDEKKATLARAIDEFARAFSILSGSPCRSCVKVVVRNSRKADTLDVSTFCRNSEEQEAGSAHPIKHNTDFNDLYQSPSQKWFFGNDLPALAARGPYGNTNAGWRTKYLSTVVWPIRRLTNNPQGEPILLGFLCVDCMRTHAFSEEFDYPLGAIVTDALYPFLASLAESIEEPKDEVFATTHTVPIQADEVRNPTVGQGVAETHEH